MPGENIQLDRLEAALPQIEVATTEASEALTVVQANHALIVQQLRDSDKSPRMAAIADRLDASVAPLATLADGLKQMAVDVQNPVPVDPPVVEPIEPVE